MNIKGLLLASAAALSAISTAQAADAIVAAEPEPLEYVRICDAYGAGYFYIPGTETCLKIGGRVRTDLAVYNAYKAGQDASARGTYFKTRAELSVDTATDTEYGALKTDQVFRFESAEGNNTSKLLWANISLGGFLVGKNDSVYSTYLGYAGDVSNDDIIEYGINNTDELNQLTYSYDSGTGLTGVVSIEDSNNGINAGANGEDSSDHYSPDAVAGLGYKVGNFGFKVVGGYDSIVQEGAIKARVDAKFGAFAPFLMAGWNTDGSKLNRYAGSFLNTNSSACPVNGADCGWGDWAFWTGYTYTFSPKINNTTMVAYTDSKILQVSSNIVLHPVKDLLVMPEVTYMHFDAAKTSQWSGELRFERKF